MSNRAIAKALGVNPSTIDDDIAGKPAGGKTKGKKNKEPGGDTAGNPAPGLTGADAAKTVAKTERKEQRQASAPIALARPQHLANQPLARHTIAGLQDHPEKFRDGVSIFRGTKRLGIVFAPRG